MQWRCVSTLKLTELNEKQHGDKHLPRCFRAHAYCCKIIPASNCCAAFSCGGRKEVLTDLEAVGVCCGGKYSKTYLLCFFSLQNHVNERFRSATFYIYFVLLIIELTLSCFKEKPPFFSSARTDPVSTSVLLYLCFTVLCLESSMENICNWKKLWVSLRFSLWLVIPLKKQRVRRVVLGFEAFFYYVCHQ